jgi:hypothetical protein
VDRGNSDFDRRHVDTFTLVYDLPNPYRGENAVFKKVLGGWEISSIASASSGSPFSVEDGYDVVLNGGSGQRPNLVGNPNLPGGRSRGDQINEWFNPAAFAMNQPGEYGTLGRNTLLGPGYFNTDIGLFKNFTIRESMKLQFRGEFFNAFNNVNLGMPDATMGSPALGQISSAGAARVVQLGLKLDW